MTPQKTIIEINWVKMEVDLRNATVIDNYKVWDRIKVLIKSYSSYESYSWVIVWFDNYNILPTIIVVYFTTYGDCKTVYYNSESKEVEITKPNERDLPYSKDDIIQRLNKSIIWKEEELKKEQDKLNLFLQFYWKFFETK